MLIFLCTFPAALQTHLPMIYRFILKGAVNVSVVQFVLAVTVKTVGIS